MVQCFLLWKVQFVFSCTLRSSFTSHLLYIIETVVRCYVHKDLSTISGTNIPLSEMNIFRAIQLQIILNHFLAKVKIGTFGWTFDYAEKKISLVCCMKVMSLILGMVCNKTHGYVGTLTHCALVIFKPILRRMKSNLFYMGGGLNCNM